MEATTFSDFRKELKSYMDKATDDFEPVTITRKNRRNAVLISEVEYKNMVENQYILSNPENLAWLQQSLDQAKHGKVEQHELVEPVDGNE